MMIESRTIGPCTLYCGNAAALLDDLSFDAFVTDPPNGWSFAAEKSPIGPLIVEQLIAQVRLGIVFPGTAQIGLYPPADGTGRMWIPDGPTQPIIYYGIQGQDLVSEPFNECSSLRHPAAKPVSWFDFAIAYLPWGTILDPFMGAGACGLACLKRDQPFIGIESVPKYYEIACERIAQAYDGKEP